MNFESPSEHNQKLILRDAKSIFDFELNFHDIFLLVI
ncbi:hypothetical protein T09_7161 [Trichinella sp. T9]|nr:hypothetical protein T09_7161 [Trichinella sp. T9]